jgi:hypothetical protein
VNPIYRIGIARYMYSLYIVYRARCKPIVQCHQLAKQKGSSLLVSSRNEAINIMKYADHARICSELMSFFGNVRVLDGGVDDYTSTTKTGDHVGTVWSVPNFPSLHGIRDIADSIRACHEKQVRAV